MAALALGAALAGVSALERLPDLCLFHRLTGLPCPTCGLTRSLAASSRLDLHQAWRFHPFGPFLLLGLVLSPAISLVPPVVRKDRRWRGAGIALALAWTAFAGLRMFGVFPGP